MKPSPAPKGRTKPNPVGAPKAPTPPRAVRRRKTKPVNGDFTRREHAALHPGVRQYDHLVADARRLANRMEKWLLENDLPEDNEAIVHFDLVVQSDLFEGSDLDEYLDHLRGMCWALRSGCQRVEESVVNSCFPEVSAASCSS